MACVKTFVHTGVWEVWRYEVRCEGEQALRAAFWKGGGLACRKNEVQGWVWAGYRVGR